MYAMKTQNAPKKARFCVWGNMGKLYRVYKQNERFCIKKC